MKGGGGGMFKARNFILKAPTSSSSGMMKGARTEKTFNSNFILKAPTSSGMKGAMVEKS